MTRYWQTEVMEAALETAPRIVQTLWLVVRVACVWLSFHGAGKLLKSRLLKDRAAGLPAVVPGMAAFMLLTLLLSLLHLLTRWFLPFIMMAGAVYGLVDLYRTHRDSLNSRRIDFPVAVPLGLIMAVLLLSDLFHAVTPHGMVDPLITYAVQPDRWLDAGGMYFLAETKFSFFPLAGEMLAVWPASLSEGMVDQLCILQLFQFSLMAGSFIIALMILNWTWRGGATALLLCLASPLLFIWGSWAKTDMTALFLSTASIALFFRRWSTKDGPEVPAAAWFLMGLAISVKLTAAFALAAVLPVHLAYSGPAGRRGLLKGLSLMVLVPAVFAIRNLIMTGEPFYPWDLPLFEPNGTWRIENIEALNAIKSHGSAAFPGNLVSLFRSWGGIGILFLAGVLVTVRSGWRKSVPLLVAVLTYAAVSCLVFDPITWGQKYAIILLPCMAAAGAFFLRRYRRTVPLAAAAFVLLTSSFTGRLGYVLDFARDGRPLQFQGLDAPPAMPLHLWANRNLPEGTRLLSMWRPERYFSDHEVLVLQNHPDGIELLLDNSLEEEFEILDRMGVDYIYFHAEDPMPGELESRVRLFSAISGEGRIRPVVEVSGYLICRIVDPYAEDHARQDADLEYVPVGRESLSCPSD